MSMESGVSSHLLLIEEARVLIAGVNTSLSERSRKQYQAAFERMAERHSTPQAMAGTVRGFYYYRAAWIHHYSTKIREILESIDVSSTTGLHTDLEEKGVALANLVSELKRHRPDPTGKNLTNGTRSVWATEVTKREADGEKVSNHSKRFRLRGLPPDWREQMFDGLRKGSKYQDIVSVLSATGARPEEFVQGIEATHGPSGTLHFVINGAKTHGGLFGQEERSFDVVPDRNELQYLLARVKSAGGRLVVKAQAGALSDKIRQLSQKVFPRLRSRISAYVYRHQFSADLKASQLPDVEVSAAMGHSVDETKGYYSARWYAQGTGRVSNILCTRPVRQITTIKMQELGQEERGERESPR